MGVNADQVKSKAAWWIFVNVRPFEITASASPDAPELEVRIHLPPGASQQRTVRLLGLMSLWTRRRR